MSFSSRNQRRQIKESVRKTQRTPDKLRLPQRSTLPPVLIYEGFYDTDLEKADDVDPSPEYPEGIIPTTASFQLVYSAQDPLDFRKQTDNNGEKVLVDVVNHNVDFSASEGDWGIVVQIGEIYVPLAINTGAMVLVKLIQTVNEPGTTARARIVRSLVPDNVGAGVECTNENTTLPIITVENHNQTYLRNGMHYVAMKVKGSSNYVVINDAGFMEDYQ